MDWPIQEAEAHFATLVETCLREAPQVVTRHGAETAVLVSADEWRHLQRSVGLSLKALLLEETDRVDLAVPPRAGYRRRDPPVLD